MVLLIGLVTVVQFYSKPIKRCETFLKIILNIKLDKKINVKNCNATFINNAPLVLIALFIF